MHIFISSHLTTHTANTPLPWHTLLGNVVAWAQTRSCLFRCPPEVARQASIKLSGNAWGWGVSKGAWCGGSPEERRRVSLHGQGSWGSAWREEGFGPRWDPREGSFKGRGLVPKPHGQETLGTEHAALLLVPHSGHPQHHPIWLPARWPHLGPRACQGQPEAEEGWGPGWTKLQAPPAPGKLMQQGKLEAERAWEHTRRCNCSLNTFQIKKRKKQQEGKKPQLNKTTGL